MDGLCKCLLLSSILAFTSVHAKKVVTIRSATISGVDEARLVIPPRYPNYDEKFSMRVDKTTPTGELEEEEEEPAFEEKYEWSVPAKYLSPGEDLTGSSVTLSFTADNLPPVEIFCTFTMTVKSGAGSVVNSPITAKKAIYLPVWDSGNPISAYLEGTTMTPSSRRAVTMNGTLSLSVSLSSYGEQDRREGATITTPWDSIVHAGGGGYSGGGENGIAAVGGAATADAGEEGESAATGSPYWIASAGSFPEGNVGESVTWKAPDTPSNGVIIQVVVDDLGQKPENEAGSADDGAAEAGRVLVDVVKTSIVRTASWIKVNDDDDDGNGTADMDDTGPVNNENDLRPAFTLTFSPSGIDVGVLTLSDISDTPGRIRVWIGDGTKQRIIDPPTQV